MTSARLPLSQLLVEEWHPFKNENLTPHDVSAGSGKKVWWNCKNKHEWEATINSRSRGNKCPYCSGLKATPGVNDLQTTEPFFASEWHPTKNGDLTVNHISAGSSKKVWWLGECDHEWDATPSERVANRTGCPYCSGHRVLAGFNDLAFHCPELADQWHPTKNSKLTSQQVTKSSGRKVWWLGTCGHEWEAIIASRTQGTGCPFCAGQRLLSGFNDLATRESVIASEWHPTKNGELIPLQITSRSGKKVWWLGQCGHEWEQKISNRTALNQNCPYCSNQKVSLGLNDFSSHYPEIAKQWHPIKNGDLTPQQVTKQSGKKAWWLGDCGHEWMSTISDRRRNGCPVCANLLIVVGINDFRTHHPDLAKEWHPLKNLSTTPDSVSSGSDFSAWWLCEKSHEWQTTVGHRTGRGKNGCPACWAATRVSKAEHAIYDYITSLGLQAEQSNRKVLQGKELDIYIPSKKIAIEFHGLYWHSEAAGKDKDYHRNKWLACKDKGIQLIQVWEDEWTRNPEQIKGMLAHKLGVSSERKVFARKTTVTSISKAEVEAFLNENHVQGFASGSYYLGLKEKVSDELIAVLVLKKEAGTDGKVLNIIRYATSANVVGGFTKLLSFAEKTYKPESFITFADHGVSDGGLYENNGFVADKELAPDYMYVVVGERKHKFGYRLKRFQNDPDLLWEEGLTERQLAALNGLERIWDSGKTRYRKTCN